MSASALSKAAIMAWMFQHRTAASLGGISGRGWPSRIGHSHQGQVPVLKRPWVYWQPGLIVMESNFPAKGLEGCAASHYRCPMVARQRCRRGPSGHPSREAYLTLTRLVATRRGSPNLASNYKNACRSPTGDAAV